MVTSAGGRWIFLMLSGAGREMNLLNDPDVTERRGGNTEREPESLVSLVRVDLVAKTQTPSTAAVTR